MTNMKCLIYNIFIFVLYPLIEYSLLQYTVYKDSIEHTYSKYNKINIKVKYRK